MPRKKRGTNVVKGMIVVVVVIITVIALFHIFPVPPSRVDREKKEAGFPEKTSPKEIEEKRSPRDIITPQTGIKIAIIIDDIGFKLAPVEELLKVSAPIAFAVLPNCPDSLTAAEIIHRAKREILLHLPMEPQAKDIDPGEGALLCSMNEQEIRQQIEKDLAGVPYATGVNNHMGSAFMEDEDKLYVVLQELQARGFFFIDSRTTPNSRAKIVAEKTGIRFASRKLFIDNNRNEEAILENLLGHLKKNKMSSMIIIGHPYPTTVKALKEAVPIIKSSGISIVSPSELVGIIGDATAGNKQE